MIVLINGSAVQIRGGSDRDPTRDGPTSCSADSQLVDEGAYNIYSMM